MTRYWPGLTPARIVSAISGWGERIKRVFIARYFRRVVRLDPGRAASSEKGGGWEERRLHGTRQSFDLSPTRKTLCLEKSPQLDKP